MFKKVIVGLIVGMIAMAPTAFSAPTSAATARIKFSTNNLSTSAYTAVMSSLPKVTKAIAVYNSSLSPLAVAIGAAGAESVQMIVPGASALGGSQSIMAPMAVSQTQRISVKALDSTAAAGEAIFTLFYN